MKGFALLRCWRRHWCWRRRTEHARSHGRSYRGRTGIREAPCRRRVGWQWAIGRGARAGYTGAGTCDRRTRGLATRRDGTALRGAHPTRPSVHSWRHLAWGTSLNSARSRLTGRGRCGLAGRSRCRLAGRCCCCLARCGRRCLAWSGACGRGCLDPRRGSRLDTRRRGGLAARRCSRLRTGRCCRPRCCRRRSLSSGPQRKRRHRRHDKYKNNDGCRIPILAHGELSYAAAQPLKCLIAFLSGMPGLCGRGCSERSNGFSRR